MNTHIYWIEGKGKLNSWSLCLSREAEEYMKNTVDESDFYILGLSVGQYLIFPIPRSPSFSSSRSGPPD